MISLSTSLLAHQKGLDRLPYLKVVALNKRVDTHLLRWSRWYTGGETDSPHASCVAADGSLIRIRNDGGNLQVSRVVAPTSVSTYSSWALLQAGLVVGSGVAAAGQAGEVLLLYTRGTTIFSRTSADSGATWGAEATVLAAGVAIGFLSVAFNLSTANACCFYTTAGTTVNRLRRTAGAWAGAGTAWTPVVASVTGVGASHNGGDFALLVSGTESVTLHKRVWVTLMGDTNLPINVWSTLRSVAEADALSTTTFAGPFIFPISAEVHGSFSAKEAGAVVYNRAFESRPNNGDVSNATWAEPAPHEAATGFGLALAYSLSATPNAVYATTPAGVWGATINQSSDLSARVIHARFNFGPEAGRARIMFDNADGGLLGSPPTLAAGLAVGTQLKVTPGYVSSAAATFEGGVIWNFTVDSITQALGRGVRWTIVEGSGQWEQLARWHAPQAWQSASGALTRDLLFARIVARAGFQANNGSGVKAPSADWGGTSPSFALPQGEDAATSLRRLLALVNDGIRTDTTAMEVNGLTAGGASTYNYGGAGEHIIESLELTDAPPAANWTRVQGPNRYADAVDSASVYQHGARRSWLRFLDATSNPRATNATANALRRAAWAQPRGALTAAFNAGQQMFDLIAVTSPNLGLSAPATYRVIGLDLDYDRVKRPTYTTRLTLGGP